MREILFRGKRLDNGEWVLSGNIIRFIPENGEDLIFIPALSEPCTCYHDEKDNIIAFEKGIFYKVDTKTVGQYTGLKDKNGKRIFEDDVCRFREWRNGEMCWVGKVHWEYQQFMISGGPNKECETMFELCMSRFIPENIEVIGNITDNPELLEK